MVMQNLVTLSVEPFEESAAPSESKQARTSSYCIFVKLPKRPERVLLVHGYTGAYDEVSADVAEFLNSRRIVCAPLHGKWLPDFAAIADNPPPADEILDELESRGYLTTLSVREERERLRSIAGLLHSFEETANSYIIVPNYNCNLRCPYCFQDHMRTDPSYGHLLRRMSNELFDRILVGIQELESPQSADRNRPRQFTLFGGEPLLAENVDLIRYMIKTASSLGPAVFGAVTNGTELESYVDLLGPEGISSLQITLDGPPRTHDLFRIYADGQGSFEKIAGNIRIALERGVPVSVRVNVCKDNIGDLPKLTAEAKQRGWDEFPHFRIYAAPIQPTTKFQGAGRVFNSHELNMAVQKMRDTDPLMEMIEIGSDGMKRRALSLFQHPEIDPVADFKASFCGAHNGMYIFDPFGDIYACWEKMGDSRIRIGQVGTDGKFVYENSLLQKWRSRTIASNPTCERCAFSLHCGGGCAVLAEAKNGEYFSNHCDGFASRFKSAVADAYEEFLTEQEIHQMNA